MATDLSKSSQCKDILEYLKEGHGITQLEALRMFGCGRLSGRIWDLRHEGHNITTRMIVVMNSKGRRANVAEYRLER